MLPRDLRHLSGLLGAVYLLAGVVSFAEGAKVSANKKG